jgi:hypothetical protein
VFDDTEMLPIQTQQRPMAPFEPSKPRTTMFAPVLIPKFFQQNRTIIDVAAGLYHSYAIAECVGMYVTVRYCLIVPSLDIFVIFPGVLGTTHAIAHGDLKGLTVDFHAHLPSGPTFAS